MEEIVSPQSQKHNLQASPRKSSSSGSQKDLWLVVQGGSVTDVDLALSLLKKNGGNINARNVFGVTPLHIATWRNHLPIVKRLLAAGADPNARDGESGWSSLHRALHFGHLAVASALIQSGASTTLEDSKCRTPIDLLSGPVMQAIGNGESSVDTEVFSWGSGVNYQLGTGNAHIQKLPCKVDSLCGSFIKLIAAAKFHSVAVTARGEVYTWGFGRGGRLGHPEFDIHSGQAAVITPRLVTSGLGARRVKAIAVAKHHTVAATVSGEVFTWGSNREGQLGYTSVDSQPTPRRVSSLRSKIVSVAAANKHTAVLSECGEVFTWGCNKEGQLGYGTSNSASNYTPRVVEYLKGKSLVGVAAAKCHTIVLGADGEVFTWGHRLVTPRHVIVARNIKKGGNALLKFHRKERLHVVSVAAGMVHSLALTEDGALFYWVSSDPDLRCQQIYSLCGRTIVSISAGKYWTAAVTATGDVYTWDGKKGKDEPLVATRLNGAKKATSVAVGETHLLLVGSLYHPVYPYSIVNCPPKLKQTVANEVDELDEGFMFSSVGCDEIAPSSQEEDGGRREAPTLKSLCEKAAAEYLVEPRNVMQLLDIADSLEADDLRKYCEDIALRNLDYILTVSAHTFSGASLDVLVDLEKLLDLRSSESWSYRRLPTPTATFPVVIHSEEEDSESELLRTRNTKPTSKKEGGHRLDCFLQLNNDENEVAKRLRVLRKKLQQIEMLEEKQSQGKILDAQQIAKLQMRPALEYSLSELGAPVETVQSIESSPTSTEGRGSKKVDATRKQRRKSRQRATQVTGEDIDSVVRLEPSQQKEFLNVHIPQVQEKDEEPEFKAKESGQDTKESKFCIEKGLEDTPVKGSLRSVSKKKSKKGGLSMFLSGALDDTPKKSAPTPQPPTPKNEGPAWGGAKIAKGSASLRVIQDEQSKTLEGQRSQMKEQVGDASVGKSGGKIPLSSFMSSKPIAVVTAKTSQVPDGDKNTPPWAASGTPPLLSRPSLRDIQIQQVKHHASLAHSPKASTAGFSIPSGQGSSPSDSAGLNKWFKPEVDAPSSIRSIQIEEKAIKDLKRFYSCVRIVKNQS